MSPRLLTLTALCALACSSTKTPEAMVPQAPTTQAASSAHEGVAIDPDELRRLMMSRDTDEDGVNDYDDNCQLLPNPNQSNQDADEYGDLCDACPTEGGNVQLGCPQMVGPTERIPRDDWRSRHAGSDWDQDGVPMPQDNCPLDANPDQADPDGDGWGSMCDRCDDEASPDTVDGCIAGTRWAVDVAIAADPQGFCLETCAVLETCHMITARFPGQTGSLVRAQCEASCKTDPAMRDRLNTLGSAGTLLTTACDLDSDMQESFRLWDTFACDQLYCDRLASQCSAQVSVFDAQGGCIQRCLDFGSYRPGAYGEQANVGINCLIQAARNASGATSCTQALVENTTCPRQ